MPPACGKRTQPRHPGEGGIANFRGQDRRISANSWKLGQYPADSVEVSPVIARGRSTVMSKASAVLSFAKARNPDLEKFRRLGFRKSEPLGVAEPAAPCVSRVVRPGAEANRQHPP